MQTAENIVKIALAPGNLRRVHHIALNVRDMKASRHFYGAILGLHELTGEEVPATLLELVAAGKVANFVTPDGTVIDLFWQPELEPPNPDPEKAFTRVNHSKSAGCGKLSGFSPEREATRGTLVPVSASLDLPCILR